MPWSAEPYTQLALLEEAARRLSMQRSLDLRQAEARTPRIGDCR